MVVEVHIQLNDGARHKRTDRHREDGFDRTGGIDVASNVARQHLGCFPGDLVSLLPIVQRRLVANNARGTEQQDCNQQSKIVFIPPTNASSPAASLTALLLLIIAKMSAPRVDVLYQIVLAVSVETVWRRAFARKITAHTRLARRFPETVTIAYNPIRMQRGRQQRSMDGG